ncbi:MAG TPA: PLDc_N domain-containing protein [Firmicutes bacterium]|nr:PLDc_N domain-containing protein [Bacillota bacterium]
MDAYGYFWIYGLFMAATVIYLLAIIWVFRDADETYGTGLFWALCMIVVPLITFPVYLLMRMGTHRSVDEDLAAWKRRERRQRLGYRHSGMVMDLSNELQDEVRWQEGNDGYTIGTARKPENFKPFSHTFADSAERLRRLKQDAEPAEQPEWWKDM